MPVVTRSEPTSISTTALLRRWQTRKRFTCLPTSVPNTDVGLPFSPNPDRPSVSSPVLPSPKSENPAQALVDTSLHLLPSPSNRIATFTIFNNYQTSLRFLIACSFSFLSLADQQRMRAGIKVSCHAALLPFSRAKQLPQGSSPGSRKNSFCCLICPEPQKYERFLAGGWSWWTGHGRGHLTVACNGEENACYVIGQDEYKDTLEGFQAMRP
ncbi:hypothetical protein BJ170DRAFT_320552 [Xylariales sp. AK1849]|nr:hypothetical protein BJ170DRAFT_320552 [Xylariales sp. AK1849]